MTTYTNEAALRKLHDEVISSLNLFHLDKVLSLLSDNIVLVEADMPAITGKAEVLQLFTRFQQEKFVYKLSYTIQKLEVPGTTAFVHGQLMKQIAQNNEAPVQEAGKFVTLCQKQEDGRWLMHAIANNDQSKFSFFNIHFRTSERITRSTVINDGIPEEGTKDVSEGSPKDLVHRMILSAGDVLHHNSLSGQTLSRRQPDILNDHRISEPE